MSAPISDEALDDSVFSFEGVDDLRASWREGLRPDPFMTVSGWADTHRMLAARASAEPGRYRTSRTPYMREIMDALSPGSSVQRVVFMKAARCGFWKTIFHPCHTDKRIALLGHPTRRDRGCCCVIQTRSDVSHQCTSSDYMAPGVVH